VGMYLRFTPRSEGGRTGHREFKLQYNHNRGLSQPTEALDLSLLELHRCYRLSLVAHFFLPPLQSVLDKNYFRVQGKTFILLQSRENCEEGYTCELLASSIFSSWKNESIDS
jgi:hypothetical protein